MESAALKVLASRLNERRGAESIGSAGLGLSEQCSGARSGLMWGGSEARPASHARQYLALI